MTPEQMKKAAEGVKELMAKLPPAKPGTHPSRHWK
jgi:hypothetical protein